MKPNLPPRWPRSSATAATCPREWRGRSDALHFAPNRWACPSPPCTTDTLFRPARSTAAGGPFSFSSKGSLWHHSDGLRSRGCARACRGCGSKFDYIPPAPNLMRTSQRGESTSTTACLGRRLRRLRDACHTGSTMTGDRAREAHATRRLRGVPPSTGPSVVNHHRQSRWCGWPLTFHGRK